MIGFIEISFILIGALIIPGIISITKAKLGGRKGPVLFQPIFDCFKLLRKGSVYSTTTSLLFQLGPIIYFASVLVACLFVPFGTHKGTLSFEGDFIIFAYTLGIGKFFLILAALDTGSSFEGMGANREALYSMLVEPAFFILIASFGIYTQDASFHDIFKNVNFNSYFSYLLAGLAIYILFNIAMIENSRMPVDDPKTHLELTMVHEVMVLDHSGFELGLTKLASALKFSMYASLIANFLMPHYWSLGWQIVMCLSVQVGFAITVGFMESFSARNKINKNPQFILTLSSVALLVFIAVLIISKYN